MLIILIGTFIFSGCDSKKPPVNATDINKTENTDEYQQGIIEMNKGNTAAAISLLNKELEKNPKDSRAYIMLALIHSQADDFETAKNILETAIANDAGNGDIYFKISKCYYQLEQYEKARQSIKSAIDIYKESGMATNYKISLELYKQYSTKVQEKSNVPQQEVLRQKTKTENN